MHTLHMCGDDARFEPGGWVGILCKILTGIVLGARGIEALSKALLLLRLEGMLFCD